MSKTARETGPNFEKDMDAIEKIVAALEEGGLSLDESLKRFEEGSKLALRCEKALQEAEKKIGIRTMNAAGELEAKPFVPEETSSPPARKRPAHPAREDDIPLEPEHPEEAGELLF